MERGEVIALAVMPGVTSGTVWPFRLRFLTARSALVRVADQVQAGQVVSVPLDAGPFRLAASGRSPDGRRRPADRLESGRSKRIRPPLGLLHRPVRLLWPDSRGLVARGTRGAEVLPRGGLKPSRPGASGELCHQEQAIVQPLGLEGDHSV